MSGSADELSARWRSSLATVGYAIGPLIIKRSLADRDALGPMAVALAIAAVMLAPAALLVARRPRCRRGDAVGSLVALGLLCTAVAFVLWFSLIAEVGPSRASVITYVNPVVAVALGVALLGESLTASAVAGLLLILAVVAVDWLRAPSRAVAGRPSASARGRRGRRVERRVRRVRPAGPVHAAAGVR